MPSSIPLALRPQPLSPPNPTSPPLFSSMYTLPGCRVFSMRRSWCLLCFSAERGRWKRWKRERVRWEISDLSWVWAVGHKRRSRSRLPYWNSARARVLICICHGINCDRIASDGMAWHGMGWWMGPLRGYCRRQEAAAHGLNGQFKCKLANALAEKARNKQKERKAKKGGSNTKQKTTTTNKRNSFAGVACCWQPAALPSHRLRHRHRHPVRL